MAKPTEQQIQELKKLLQDLEDTRQQAETLANTTKETLENATTGLGSLFERPFYSRFSFKTLHS